ncbi:RNA pseudouridylate synthase domain-containing protein 2 isoform X2 [Eurytemora carolleeae]|uniref:RNA pseudouridylate synthase domain-containing protein 2 isoform X2 n=1 Tax=Eurytemora carolleeae TaxID=1294199 RepID=UPI000C77A2A1|nr:RNA pseudouridylate synthase domain-containing protein 2 isoform X2 [Eurytemora carolleeae]|eukprot:XP_023326991.1 RNA pseudouridylate synthase domain-containing protein 2-like isoform X2 [Eurytemora affinis]
MSQNSNDLAISDPGVVFVIQVEHASSPAGHRIQNILEKTDIVDFQLKNRISEQFCRKDKETNIQNKFSCFPCRTVLESVDALRCHLQGSKHQHNLEKPSNHNDFLFINGKWKEQRAVKRRAPDELSRREKTKKNKKDRNFPVYKQHTQEKYNETKTYIENGLRKIRPYYFTFIAHAKGRWVGKDLWTVFSEEFRKMEKEDFLRCVESGLVKVNDNKVDIDYRIQNNDLIFHTVHRHELPVTDIRIDIVHDDDDYLVVDKPPSIPVHPCGRYRHNTLLFILAKEYGYTNLHTVHRLDRLTSGVLMFAKNSHKSRDMETMISGSFKIGVCIVSKDGKESRTVFKRLQYKDGVSIVSCKPKTGRMHQIRVHLQYLGFPISNDPLYNSDIFGAEKGKGGLLTKTKDKLMEDLMKRHTVDTWMQSDEYINSRIQGEEENVNYDDGCDDDDDGGKLGDSVEEGVPIKEQQCTDDLVENAAETPILEEEKKGAKISRAKDGSSLEDEVDEFCLDCKRTFKDPPKDTLFIYLHSMRYSGEGWEYKTKLPSWATI